MEVVTLGIQVQIAVRIDEKEHISLSIDKAKRIIDQIHGHSYQEILMIYTRAHA